MTHTKLAFMAIPLLAVLMIGAAMTPVYSVPESIEIDIKPGGFPNSINPGSMGLVPVAILGTDDFDVGFVDVQTLEFGPDGASPVHDGHFEDVNDDGLTDLVTHYVQKETGIEKGDEMACSQSPPDPRSARIARRRAHRTYGYNPPG